MDQTLYKKTVVGTKDNPREVDYFDGSDALGIHGYIILIEHVPTGKSINFKAFITSFNDTFSQNWNPEEVYGRADPIYTFKNTNRKVSLGFKMVAASESEAYENLTKAQKLAKFMYPNYTDINGAKTVSQSPLIRLQIMNLLQKTEVEVPPLSNPTGEQLYNSYRASDEGGQLGFFDNVTFNWNLENNEVGVFQHTDAAGNYTGAVLPKLIEVSIGSFSPIHEQHLGWDDNKRFGRTGEEYLDNFPYGAAETEQPRTVFEFRDSESRIKDKPAYSEDELSKDERAQAEAAIANAQARYGGMFGNMRRKRDQRRLDGGKLSGDKGAYITSALVGQGGIDAGVLDDGNLSTQEVRTGKADQIDFVED